MRYDLSETVREFLVLQALSATIDGLNQDLVVQKEAAFGRVMWAIRAGSVQLDYQPARGRVNIPRLGHPHHMQALLYWCSVFDCDLGRLAEALAFAGRAPTLELVRELLGHIGEAEASTGDFDAADLNLYAATRPTPLDTRRMPALW